MSELNSQPFFPGAVPLESPEQGFSHDGRTLVETPAPAPMASDMMPPATPAPMPGAPMMGAAPLGTGTMLPPAPAPFPEQPAFAPMMGQVPNMFAEAPLAPLPPIPPASTTTPETLVSPQLDAPIAKKELHINQGLPAAASFELNPELMELAKFLSTSVFVPAAIRTTPMVDHTCDVYFLLLKARQMGLSAADAFSDLYVLASPKTGEAKIGVYVKTKAALCAPYGMWDVEITPTGDARAYGLRYSSRQRKEAFFTLKEAAARNLITLDKNGQFVGVGKWADKLNDMLLTRALGRLLDALFPDVIRNLVSLDTFNEEDYERALAQSEHEHEEQTAAGQQVETGADISTKAEFDLAGAVAKTRRGKRQSKNTASTTTITSPASTTTATPAPAEQDNIPIAHDIVEIPNAQETTATSENSHIEQLAPRSLETLSLEPNEESGAELKSNPFYKAPLI